MCVLTHACAHRYACVQRASVCRCMHMALHSVHKRAQGCLCPHMVAHTGVHTREHAEVRVHELCQHTHAHARPRVCKAFARARADVA